MKRLVRCASEPTRIPLWRHDEGLVLPVESSEWSDALIDKGGKTAKRVKQIDEHIVNTYPDIYGVDMDYEPTVGPRGGSPVGKYGQDRAFIIVYTIYSDNRNLDGEVVSTQFNREWGQVKLQEMLTAFDKEFAEICKMKGIEINIAASRR